MCAVPVFLCDRQELPDSSAALSQLVTGMQSSPCSTANLRRAKSLLDDGADPYSICLSYKRPEQAAAAKQGFMKAGHTFASMLAALTLRGTAEPTFYDRAVILAMRHGDRKLVDLMLKTPSKGPGNKDLFVYQADKAGGLAIFHLTKIALDKYTRHGGADRLANLAAVLKACPGPRVAAASLFGDKANKPGSAMISTPLGFVLQRIVFGSVKGDCKADRRKLVTTLVQGGCRVDSVEGDGLPALSWFLGKITDIYGNARVLGMGAGRTPPAVQPSCSHACGGNCDNCVEYWISLLLDCIQGAYNEPGFVDMTVGALMLDFAVKDGGLGPDVRLPAVDNPPLLAFLAMQGLFGLVQHVMGLGANPHLKGTWADSRTAREWLAESVRGCEDKVQELLAGGPAGAGGGSKSDEQPASGDDRPAPATRVIVGKGDGGLSDTDSGPSSGHAREWVYKSSATTLDEARSALRNAMEALEVMDAAIVRWDAAHSSAP